jgi:hypothetical protein
LKRAIRVHPARTIPRPYHPDSMSRRADFGLGREGDETPAARPLTDSTRTREADDFKEFMLGLLLSLLVFGWLVLIRNVRVGLPADLTGPGHAAVGAGVTPPTDGKSH